MDDFKTHCKSAAALTVTRIKKGEAKHLPAPVYVNGPGVGGARAWGVSRHVAAARHSMPEHDAYQLRPRCARRRDAARERRPRPPQPLSKYRRKTANARERCRMQEINRAFETLRRAVPAAAITGAPVPCEKLTKITTLRLAMRYIAALAAALRDPEPGPRDPPAASDPGWSPPRSDLSSISADFDQDSTSFAEDSLSPFDSFFAEFECEYVDIDRTFA